MKLNKIILLSLILLIAGCSTNTVTEYVEANNDIYIVQRPPALKLKDVQFRVKDGELIMSFNHYENLSSNLADIIEYIKNQNNIITYYENMIREQK